MKYLLRVMVLVITLLVPMAATAGDETSFNRLDSNKSDDISRDELLKSDLVVTDVKGRKVVLHRNTLKQVQSAAVTEKQKSESLALTDEQKVRLFEQLDEDKSGSVTRKEWNRASPDGFILWKF